MAAWIAPSLSLLREGLQSNWWGIACPGHCQGTGLGFLVSVFFLGVCCAALFILAVGACIYYIHWRLQVSVPCHPQEEPAQRGGARFRSAGLRGYLHAEGTS